MTGCFYRPARSTVCDKPHRLYLFCSGAVFDPRVGHTMDVLSPFISGKPRNTWQMAVVCVAVEVY